MSQASLAAANARSAERVPVAVLPLAPAAPHAPTVEAPASLTSPLTIARIQSSYTASATLGNRLVVTYNLVNTNPAVDLPPISSTATLTDNLELLNGFVSTNDPNSIRSVLLVNSILPTATLLSSSHAPDALSGTLAFRLNDIAPQASVMLTLALQVPATSTNFVSFDSGAKSYGSYRGRMVTASAPAIQFAPDSLSEFLIWTQDANTADEEMLARNGIIGGGVTDAFEYVRGLGNEVYQGSLRGTRGTLWGEAGNSLDKSSLLIALLRSRAIPARYRHGTLGSANSQTLIASMFPNVAGVVGTVQPDATVSAPMSDTALLTDSSDHWWVEAYVPGSGWTDFDPSFATAAAGQTFYATLAGDGSDRVAEVPDAKRHKIVVWLKTESYNAISGFTTATPLTHTFSAVQLNASPLVLGHFVDTKGIPGLVFATSINTYSPYFTVGATETSEVITGTAYQDIVSNFAGPAGSQFHTGAWLNFELHAPNGETLRYERPLVDRLGLAARLNGGDIDVSLTSTTTLFTANDTFVTWFTANRVPESAVLRAAGEVRNGFGDVAADIETANTLSAVTNRTAEQQADLQSAQFRLALSLARQMSQLALTGGHNVDIVLGPMSDASLVKAYYSRPRIVTVGVAATVSGQTATPQATVDFRRMTMRMIAYPGQDTLVTHGLGWQKGVMESRVEQLLLATFTPTVSYGAASVFDEAIAQGIPATLINSSTLDRLDALGHSDVTNAYVVTAVLQGKSVVIPSRPVVINGKAMGAWYEVDDATGETIGKNETGLNVGFAEYKQFLFVGGAPVAFLAGMTVSLWEFILTKLAGGNQTFGVVIGGGIELFALAEVIVNVICAIEAASGNPAALVACQKMYWAGSFLGKLITSFITDPPAPTALFSEVNTTEPRPSAGLVVTPTATLTGNALSGTLDTQHVFVFGDGSIGSYAPALSGLGVGSALTGSTFANFSNSGRADLANGAAMASSSSGAMSVGVGSLNGANGIAVLNFTGTLTVTEQSATTDRLRILGVGDAFAVSLAPGASSINPVQSASFVASIDGNATRAYTLTAEAPADWNTQLDAQGRVTVTPPLGEAAGDYLVLVSAQAREAPLVLASALHTVTVQAFAGMQLNVELDSLTTVPYGPARQVAPDTVSNGQLQLPNAAYDIRITNTSQVSHTFSVNVTGLPAGWAVFSANPGGTSANVTLEAGQSTLIGLLISPTTGLPAAGSNYNFSVTATALDNGSLTATENEVFTVASVAYAFLVVTPTVVYASPLSPTQFLLGVDNVGNATGTFTLTAVAPFTTWAVSLASPVNLVAAGGAVQTVTFTPTGDAGDTSSLVVRTSSGGYTQTTGVEVRLTTPQAACVYRAGYGLLDLGEAVPRTHIEAVAGAAAALESDPTNTSKRDALIAAINALLVALGNYPDMSATSALQMLASDLAAHTTAGQIAADLQTLCSTSGVLAAQLLEVAEHKFELSIAPGTDATLPGRSITFTVNLTQRGTTTTTYAMTITSPALGSPITLNPVLASGTSTTQTVVVTSAVAGFIPVYASATAFTGDASFPTMSDSAVAGATFITPVLSVLSITPSPNFVDFGSSAVNVSAVLGNVANWRVGALATLNVVAPGGAVSATASVPASVLQGNTTSVNFGSINTSGFATGTYTLTVSVAVTSPVGLAGGAPVSNYALFGVGQALVASGLVSPSVVPPGNVTVTTIITTYVDQTGPVVLVAANSNLSARNEKRAATNAPKPVPVSRGDVSAHTAEEVESVLNLGKPMPARAPETIDEPRVAEAAAAVDPQPDASEAKPTSPELTVAQPDAPASPLSADFVGGGITRTDIGSGSVGMTGTWLNLTSDFASGGAYSRSSAVSSTLSFTFTGVWVSVGYLARTNGRHFEVFIDGVSQGSIDSYARIETPLSRVYSGLITGTHVISVFVLSTKNAFADFTGFANIDFFDVWDGSAMSDGTFEHTSSRVILSSGWITDTLAAASGGSYGRSGNTTGAAWFAFTGDSMTYQYVKDFQNEGMVSIFVDGTWKADLNRNSTFDNATETTATLSFDGLGAGAHVLTLSRRRGNYFSLDTFTTPGSAPFYAPPTPTGIVRYEERSPAVTFNGVPFTRTAQSWAEAVSIINSDGYVAQSSTASDTVTLVFSGTWVSLGYLADDRAGNVEVFIDGASQGLIDTFANEPAPRSRAYGGLSAGAHVISVTVLGTKNSFATAPGYFYFDYFDVWDGTTLSDGTFQEDSQRVWFGDGWDQSSHANASGGYYGDNPPSTGAVWFPFTGDSVSYQSLHGVSSAGVVNVYVDGQFKARLDQGTPITGTTNFTGVLSFNGLGAGAHVMVVHHVRNPASTVDYFATPGAAPFYTPPTRTGIVRYEEWDTAVRYNGVPLTVTASNWDEASSSAASDGFIERTSVTSNSVSLAFSGTWVSLGYVAASNAGQIEVFIDGASQGVIDTYGPIAKPRSKVYAGLSAGAHVISATRLSTKNSFASNQGFFNFDYFDVWDGSALPDGSFEENSPRVWYSSLEDWSQLASSAASGGYYADGGLSVGAAWFAFTGDSVTMQTLAGFHSTAGEVTVWIDGVFKAHHELYALTEQTKTLSLNGLGAGPHVLTMAWHRNFRISLDKFQTPGVAPFANSAQSGVFRLEEDDPALRYNSAPLTQTSTTWDDEAQNVASNRYVYRSSTPSDTVGITFAGQYVGVGFVSRTDGRQAEVFLDGASQGVVDLYSASEGVVTRIYTGLVSATHVISVMVLSTFNVSATGISKWARLDYFDVWDGTQEPQGLFNHDDARVYISNDWTTKGSPNAINRAYIEDGTSAWFLFTGVSLTVIAVTDQFTTAKAEVLIDDVSAGLIDLYYPFGRVPKSYVISGLTSGAHVVRLRDASGATERVSLDAFQTGGTHPGAPMVEWSFTNFVSPTEETLFASPAVGDLNADGVPEIVVGTSDVSCFIGGNCSGANRSLYALRGDTGAVVFSTTITGTTSTFNILNGEIYGGIGSPALVNLDGGNDVEIVVDTGNGLRAYKNDGTLMWWNQSIKGTLANGVAAANLDDDEAPELVAASNQQSPSVRKVFVVQADGTATWSYTLTNELPGPRLPTLADMNGDGKLDIVLQSGKAVYLFHNNGVSMTFVASRTMDLRTYGGPAIADIDNDGLPEIVAGFEGVVAAFEHDLTQKWVYTTGGVFPSPISVADLDGDGQPNIVVYQKTTGGSEDGRIFALKPDGTLLWSSRAADTATSSAGLITFDFDDDDKWDVVWNGSTSGTLILRGSDGEVVFHDDQITSPTVNDTPIVADVDNDGRAEVVLLDFEGLRVLGFDAGWPAARPLWNQHAYHVTNINDDLTVPQPEPNSWEWHNTYRTQVALAEPYPAYEIEVSHTVAMSMTVLTPTFTAAFSDFNPIYYWAYKHYPYEPERSKRFSAVISNVLPGEARKVSEGTVVSYTLEAGSNRVFVPPLYVFGAHIVSLSPLSRTVNRGSRAQFDLVLTNPSASSDAYSLTVAGLPSSFAVSLPLTVSLSAGASLTLSLAVDAPADAALATHDFVVNVRNSLGGSETAPASLSVVESLRVALSPDQAFVSHGNATSFQLLISNTESVTRTYAISMTGLGANTASHAATRTIGANASATVPVTITANGEASSILFTAQVSNTATGVYADDMALLDIAGSRGVTATLSPATTTVGLGTDGYLTLTLTNLGTLDDTYTFTLTAPQFWYIESVREGDSTGEQSLPPSVLNSVNLRVRVNAGFAASAGSYPITVTVRSKSNPSVQAVANGTVTVVDKHVEAYFTPYDQTSSPLDSTTWDLTIYNYGSAAETFVITGVGPLASLMNFAQTSVNIPANDSANVSVVISAPVWAQVGVLDVAALVFAQSDPSVASTALGQLEIEAVANSEASLSPPSQSVTNAMQVSYLFVISNTGNVDQLYSLSLTSTAQITLATTSVFVPANSAGAIEVVASAPVAGRHPITVTATSPDTSGSASAMLNRGAVIFVPNTRRSSSVSW